MKLTVEEALTRICPLTMGREEVTVEDCRGDRCMAWRWAGPQDYETEVLDLPDVKAWNQQHPRPDKVDRANRRDWGLAAVAFAKEIARQLKDGGETRYLNFDPVNDSDGLAIYARNPIPRRGYCGLAGKSEWW